MIKTKILIGMLGLCLAFPFFTRAQTQGFERALYANKKDTLPYRILMPQNFDPEKKYALVIVLHGSGERGSDNEAQLKYGTGLFLNANTREKFPLIAVFPQCPKDSYWSNVDIKVDSVTRRPIFNFQEGGDPTKAMHALLGLVNELLHKPYVDKHQVYIGGLSMGGMGTFEIIRRKPKVFAAAFAIAGGDHTANAKKYAKKVPLWIFHGAKDNVVTADHSEVVVDAIKAAGGEPRFTLYPNDTHNSWDHAFAEPDLLPWLFAHRK